MLLSVARKVKPFSTVVFHSLFSSSFVGYIDPRISGLIWSIMFASLAAVITVPGTNVIRVYSFSTILRMIFSVGLQPTLWMLGTVNVSFLCVFQ